MCPKEKERDHNPPLIQFVLVHKLNQYRGDNSTKGFIATVSSETLVSLKER